MFDIRSFIESLLNARRMWQSSNPGVNPYTQGLLSYGQGPQQSEDDVFLAHQLSPNRWNIPWEQFRNQWERPQSELQSGGQVQRLPQM